MLKNSLIFEWKEKEGRLRDAFFALFVVSIAFTICIGIFDLRLPEMLRSRSQSADFIRFTDPSMADYWLRKAQENGPFPGESYKQLGEFNSLSGLDTSFQPWSKYEPNLRPFSKKDEIEEVKIAPQGTLVFPKDFSVPMPPSSLANSIKKYRRIPILIPYDREISEYFPSELPVLKLPENEKIPPGTLKYIVHLKASGWVSDAISLQGSGDATQDAVLRWLRQIRFKESTEDLWIGLGVELINQAEDVTPAP